MKIDPGIHIVMHLVFFGKIGVTLSRVRIISRKAVGKFKDIEINFHAKKLSK
jgi:hypothetical protein